jgi:CRISPR-associated endonuclease Cas1
MAYLSADELATSSVATDWVERGEHWRSVNAAHEPRRLKRERNTTPLILCGHGVSLRIENSALLIRDGYTHYPQEQSVHRFFPGSYDIPERILLLDGSGTLSFDVLSWLAEQNVALARVKWTGEVATVASGTGFVADREKVQWQRETLADEAKRMAFAADLIRRKLIASIATLKSCLPPSARRDDTIDRHRIGADRLARETFADMNDIRAVEGQCASMYFIAWQGMTIKWKGRRPVPDEWRRYVARSSLSNGPKPQNRNASHPVNAILNYAYAVKLAHMQIQAIADGYDPTIGIMHHGRRGKPSFIFDLIEPERPKVDAAVLAFVHERTFAAADFILRSDGGCRLSPQLAGVVATLASQST